MATQRRDLSSALLTAQRRLERLREDRQKERPPRGQPSGTEADGRTLRPDIPRSGDIPAHLGWESAPLTAALRAAQKQRQIVFEQSECQDLSWLKSLLPREQQTPASPLVSCENESQISQITQINGSNDQNVKVYPDIALGMLRTEQAASGRIWLLLRHLDESGCGWVSIALARQRLTTKKSPLRVCGWRQLRKLLAQGENIFWQRQNDRIWLRSITKVAASLGVWQLQHRPVALPVAVLNQGIGTVRAHFYASFHSGRGKETTAGKEQSRPIARATITEITQVNPRTQRVYEKRANVQKQRNFALGGIAAAGREQECAWRQGRALFRFTDRLGRQGKPGTLYLAWQLPNSYVGPHRQRSKGQQKRINRELTDLFMQGITGNGQETVKGDEEYRRQRFYGNGRLAAKAYNSGSGDIYWRSCQRAGKDGRYRLWYFLPELQK
ncbi:MAG TPA: hypothetical protein VF177_03665 [Anaerolineae bacterium]